MISFLAILLTLVVLLLSLTQTLLVIQYYWFHRDAQTEIESPVEPENFPKAAIILCLRGHEESTPECIAELIGQDYPDYQLHIAFDSPDDPAAKQVEDFFESHNSNVHLHFFEPQADCSYKCSGIVHVLDQLSDDVEIVAFCDGDAIVDVNWLRDLAIPMMQDASIGATTGNRWFAPYNHSIGALIRKHWNAAAVVQMQAYDIAWGGSMAVRKSTIERCNLREHWQTTFCEDTVITNLMKQQGLRLHRVPNLVVENREATTLSDCFEWIARQLLTVRLHHPGWPLVLGHGVATGLATIVAPIAAVLMFATGYTFAGRSVFIIWMVYQILNLVLLWVIERCNLAAIAQRNASEVVQSAPSSDMSLLALPGVQILHPLAVLKAFFMSTVKWRGVTYAIDANRVRVKESE
ncbi:glycosyltransferase [Mariniblastus fucicola]|uniref:N-glycosyltransferase n=1 Tax=Mariniblastus fucicola TaxID=980251 RepID=A0A5B9PNM1_9BACT|nr:glycosyltransferase family 2 protein [Mariniblastus fucicola]QEG23853.1 N-glycosyltransferase [Mariniblastus fucicola]